MTREQLIEEALQVGKNAKYNLELIRKQPEKMLPGKMENAEKHLNRMIQFSEMEIMIRFLEIEIKNAQLADRTFSLKSLINDLNTLIISPFKLKNKRKNA